MGVSGPRMDRARWVGMSIQHNSGEEPMPPNGGWILFTTILGSSLAFIDGTVVNVALPFLQQDLDASATGVQWVVQAYSLFLASLILVGGSLGDRLGRRKMYLVGVIVFTVASAAAAAAPNLETLIGARILQGIGGALLIPGSLSIISAQWTGAARGVAIGTWAGFTSITSAIGPVLGGFLVEQLSWRSVFFINLPIAVIVVVTCVIFVPESRSSKVTGPIDWAGAALVTISLGGLVFGFTQAASSGWVDAMTIGSLAVALVSGAIFLAVERRVEEPMVELSLFRSRTFTGTNLLTLLVYAGLGGALYYLPFNLVQVQDYSATAAGAALLPFVLVMFAGSRWAGGLIGRFGARLPLVIGPVITGFGYLLFALPDGDGSYWTTIFPATVVLGVGMTITVAPLTTTVMDAVDNRYSGLASGVNNAVSRAGGVLAIALFSIIMLGTFNTSLKEDLSDLSLNEDVSATIEASRDELAGMPVPASLEEGQRQVFRNAVNDAFTEGYRLVMMVSALIAFLGAGIAAMTVPGGKTIDCGIGEPAPMLQSGGTSAS